MFDTVSLPRFDIIVIPSRADGEGPLSRRKITQVRFRDLRSSA
jgi:hypothetical protein